MTADYEHGEGAEVLLGAAEPDLEALLSTIRDENAPTRQLST